MKNNFLKSLQLLALSTAIISSQAYGDYQNNGNDASLGEPSTNLYISGNIGANFYRNYIPKPSGGVAPIGKDVVNPGQSYLLKFGYKFNPYISMELEYNYTKNSFNKFKVFRTEASRNLIKGNSYPIDGYVRTQEFMLNTILHANNSTRLTPFVGAGIGYINYIEKNYCGNPKITKPGYQLIAGMDYAINNRFSAIIEYQFVKMNKARIQNKCLSPKVNHRLDNITLGLQYNI